MENEGHVLRWWQALSTKRFNSGRHFENCETGQSREDKKKRGGGGRREGRRG